MSIQPVGRTVVAREQGECEIRLKAIDKPMVNNSAEVREMGRFKVWMPDAGQNEANKTLSQNL